MRVFFNMSCSKKHALYYNRFCSNKHALHTTVLQRVYYTAGPNECVYYCSTYHKVVRVGTREEPGTFTQGGALFSLVPLVWESNPKLQGGWCKTQPPAHRSDPNHQGICFFFLGTTHLFIRRSSTHGFSIPLPAHSERDT
jgi:hypothetical protein